MTAEIDRTTTLLRGASRGDAGAADQLFGLVYAELRRVAQRLMASEPTAHTLQATALVHEAYVRLLGGGAAVDWTDRAHFVRTAARAMRNVLVDHARAARRDKRGGGAEKRGLDLVLDEIERGGEIDVVALHDALARFAALDEQAARVVELRFFAGLSIEDAARVLEVSTPTVERAWRTARLWLSRELGPGDPRT
jgi:RNA polymerase sigma factor (TIGR02999 family)